MTGPTPNPSLARLRFLGTLMLGAYLLINALLLIICIAIGLSATLLMVKNSLL